MYGDYLGGYPGAGQRYATNAREMSLGNALSSEYNEGFNAFSNPALITQSKGLEFGSSYFFMTLDRFVQTFSVTRKLPPSAGASLSVFRSGVQDIPGKNFSNESTGTFESSESYVMFSFGISMIESIALGFNIKAIFNNIEDYSADGLSGDLGLLYNFSDRLAFSWVASNIFGEYYWDSLTATSGKFEEELPMINSVGLKFDFSDDVKIFSKLDYMAPEEVDFYRFQAGAEIDRADYVLRFGLIQNQGLDSEDPFNFKILLGAGTYLKVFKNHKIKLDYCIDLGKEEEGISNLFSLSFIR